MAFGANIVGRPPVHLPPRGENASPVGLQLRHDPPGRLSLDVVISSCNYIISLETPVWIVKSLQLKIVPDFLARVATQVQRASAPCPELVYLARISLAP